MPRARAAARRAIELDPNLAEGHTWLVMVLLFFDWDWPAAEREFQAALELNPKLIRGATGIQRLSHQCWPA